MSGWKSFGEELGKRGKMGIDENICMQSVEHRR